MRLKRNNRNTRLVRFLRPAPGWPVASRGSDPVPQPRHADPGRTPDTSPRTTPDDPSWAFPGFTRTQLQGTINRIIDGGPCSPLPLNYYLSGPMNGYPENNFPAFERETTWLRRLGYKILSPHEVAHESAKNREDYLRGDLIEMLQKCNGIIMMNDFDWLSSWGACFEFNVAAKLRFKLYLMQDSSLYDAEMLRRYVR